MPYRPRESDLRLMIPEFGPALRMTLEMLVCRRDPSFSRTAMPYPSEDPPTEVKEPPIATAEPSGATVMARTRESSTWGAKSVTLFVFRSTAPAR